MPGVFPDYPTPVIRNTDAGTEMVTMRWGKTNTAKPVHGQLTATGTDRSSGLM
jgi:hypothetical protein